MNTGQPNKNDPGMQYWHERQRASRNDVLSSGGKETALRVHLRQCKGSMTYGIPHRVTPGG